MQRPSPTLLALLLVTLAPLTKAADQPKAKTSINITVNALANRHAISPYIYGVNFPPDTNYITQTGATLARWGGNAASLYNWKNFDTNAAADWYFDNRPMGDPPLYEDSTQFVGDVSGAGAAPIMTVPMLSWVAKDDSSYSFSVAKYGAQCYANPYNSDDGIGIKTDCSTPITGNDPKDADVALLDQPGNNDPPGSVYRNQWVGALRSQFGGMLHLYDMDNEPDIWGSTHRDVHPNPSGYDELLSDFLHAAPLMKSWDPKAMRMGPVSCCWWFYWNGANNNDKAAHGGVDFLPWWLNGVYWSDKLSGARSLDVFDIHAYPDAPDTSGWTQAQKQALALRIMRDWWDPTYVSESGGINQQWATFLQPNKTIPFRIPRMRAIANMNYPGTPLTFTEWNAAIAGESDFSTALVDIDAWGILGRERAAASTRWVAADPSTPAYLSLQMFRNYDGQRHTFGNTSISTVNDGDSSLFSSYGALNASGTTLTLLALNKDPQNSDPVQINLSGFTATRVTAYTLSSANPTKIIASSPQAWAPNWSFAPYSATLLVIKGNESQAPGSEWDLNPDVIQIPANGTYTLQPKIVSGSATVTLTGVQSDSGITLTIQQAQVSQSQKGKIGVTAGGTSGFYHFTVTGKDTAGVTQTQSGWILVGNPAATLSKSGDGQHGPPGGQLTLSVALNPGQSGGNAQGATVLFTTSAGSLSSRLVNTDSSGNAKVTLTLPNQTGTIHLTAEGQFALGHPTATFTETAQ